MTPTLSVARDALLEQATIADVLDLARTMALERLARGLPVAWVGPEADTSTPVVAWLAVMETDGSGWLVRRNGMMLIRPRWSVDVISHRLATCLTVLDGDTTRAAWGA